MKPWSSPFMETVLNVEEGELTIDDGSRGGEMYPFISPLSHVSTRQKEKGDSARTVRWRDQWWG